MPSTIAESVVDHDYAVLAMKKYTECAKDFWMGMITAVKRLTPTLIEPIRNFLHHDLRAFKDIRRNYDQTQKNFDTVHAKFAALGKTKEPSYLREEAFQLHEARKAYLRASMDFFSLAPQIRFSFDKLTIRIYAGQFNEMRNFRDISGSTMQRNSQDVERVQGWVREMENSEQSFRKELISARRQLEDGAESSHRPSRELEDHTSSTVPYLGTPSTASLQKSPRRLGVSTGEKQGWLYLRTYTGRPTRVQWIKRWAFVRNGIFGFLVQGGKAGGVEESERIGVLLCNARPAPGEERRFCFEIKTNKNTIFLQAETQNELASWLATFETAKSRALEYPATSDLLAKPGQAHSDPAFAISAPPLPEFGTSVLPSLEPGASEDASGSERSGALAIPPSDGSRESTDLQKRTPTPLSDETNRDHGSKIISKLDIVRKSSANPPIPSSPSTPTIGGGIASLIAASHGSMPVGPSIPLAHADFEQFRSRQIFRLAPRDMPASSLAPSTLTDPPAPTNMSRTAVIVTGERGISAATDKIGIPNGLLANTWGSSGMAFVNRLGRAETASLPDGKSPLPSSPLLVQPRGSPATSLSPQGAKEIPDLPSMSTLDLGISSMLSRSRTPSPEKRHRNTISLDQEAAKQARTTIGVPEFPNYYPLQLKTQDAQFRLLFPNVRQDERLVLVFRASWDPNDDQEFPGRAYVTMKDIYFYSNHLGLVLTSHVSLSSIEEVTAAPGRDSDFLFFHLCDTSDADNSTRITVKIFLEPLRLLQRRLRFLVKNSVTDEPLGLEEVIKALLKMESETSETPPSLESWDDVTGNMAVDNGQHRHRARTSTFTSEFRAPVHVDSTLGTQSHLSNSVPRESVSKLKLPAQPVLYTPPGNLKLAADRYFDVSPKVLFHVLFGDKSAVWQLLRRDRLAQDLKQEPWRSIGEGRLRREFHFRIPSTDALGRKRNTDVTDYQMVDVNNEHLCYVVTDKRTAWHLPFRRYFRLVSKIVITHVAKSRCKLAIFIKVEWLRTPWVLKRGIEHQAYADLEVDALDLVNVAGDQVRRLGPHSRTKKAIQIFGQVGQSTEVTQLQIDNSAFSIEMRSVPTERSMLGLLWQEFEMTISNIAGTLFDTIFKLLRWIWRTSLAHYFLLGLLAASILLNAWYSSRDSLDWWHERNAGNFMRRLGVSPNHVMSKAVYINDLDNLLQRGDFPQRDSNACFSVFYDSYNFDDLDRSPTMTLTTSRSAQNIHRTRQKLGTYRHDLLVAMRVVNSVETELIISEWEQWLLLETRRCRQVESLLPLANNETEKDNSLPESHHLQQWYDEYCLSCEAERAKLVAR